MEITNGEPNNPENSVVNPHAAKITPHPRNQYVFTYNNYTEAGEQALQKFICDNCKIGFYGHEVAPETGTKHLQGMPFAYNKKILFFYILMLMRV